MQIFCPYWFLLIYNADNATHSTFLQTHFFFYLDAVAAATAMLFSGLNYFWSTFSFYPFRERDKTCSVNPAPRLSTRRFPFLPSTKFSFLKFLFDFIFLWLEIVLRLVGSFSDCQNVMIGSNTHVPRI